MATTNKIEAANRTSISPTSPRNALPAKAPNATLEKLQAGIIAASRIHVDDGYVGDGYGVPAESTMEAISLTAKLEGVLLDPVYSAKGMAGLIGLVRQGFFKSSDNVLFLHTGGSAALFAYEAALRE